MRFDYQFVRKVTDSLPFRYGFIAIVWLIVISTLHYHLNVSCGDRTVVRMGYMPVITNLAAPLLDYVSKESGNYRFQAVKFSSFAEMAEALRNDNIDVAFIIAPLAVVLKQQGENVRIVYIGNRSESTLVVRKGVQVKNFRDLSGKTLAVPMRYSGHYLEILRLEKDNSLEPAINIVEMNPPDMAVALAAGSLDAYFVGEPFAAQSIQAGDAVVFKYVEEISPDFICNLVLIKQELIDRNPELVQSLVATAARSGVWAGKHPATAARIVSLYWNQPQSVVEYAMTTPKSRIEYRKFIPDSVEIQRLADIMVEYQLIDSNNIDSLVNSHFARSVDLQGITDIESIYVEK